MVADHGTLCAGKAFWTGKAACTNDTQSNTTAAVSLIECEFDWVLGQVLDRLSGDCSTCKFQKCKMHHAYHLNAHLNHPIPGHKSPDDMACRASAGPSLLQTAKVAEWGWWFGGLNVSTQTSTQRPAGRQKLVNEVLFTIWHSIALVATALVRRCSTLRCVSAWRALGWDPDAVPFIG